MISLVNSGISFPVGFRKISSTRAANVTATGGLTQGYHKTQAEERKNDLPAFKTNADSRRIRLRPMTVIH